MIVLDKDFPKPCEPEMPIMRQYVGGRLFIGFQFRDSWWVTSYGNKKPLGPFTKEEATEKVDRLATESA